MVRGRWDGGPGEKGLGRGENVSQASNEKSKPQPKLFLPQERRTLSFRFEEEKGVDLYSKRRNSHIKHSSGRAAPIPPISTVITEREKKCPNTFCGGGGKVAEGAIHKVYLLGEIDFGYSVGTKRSADAEKKNKPNKADRRSRKPWGGGIGKKRGTATEKEKWFLRRWEYDHRIGGKKKKTKTSG